MFFVVVIVILVIEKCLSLEEFYSETFGSQEAEELFEVMFKDDGSIYIAGHTNGWNSAKNYVLFLAELNPIGEIEWMRTYGDDSAASFDVYVSSSFLFPNGEFTVTGKLVYNLYDRSFFITFYENGTMKYNLVTSTTEHCETTGILCDDNSQHILILRCYVTFPQTRYSVYFIRLLENRTISSVYEMSSYEMILPKTVSQTLDGGFVFSGEMHLIGDDPSCFILKLSKDLVIQWSRLFWSSIDPKITICSSVRETSNGDFLMVGYRRNIYYTLHYALLFRLNSTGSVLWTKQISVPSMNLIIYDLEILGTTNNPDDLGFMTVGSARNSIITFDGNGDLLSSKRSLKFNKDSNSYRSIRKTPENNLLIIGQLRTDAIVSRIDKSGIPCSEEMEDTTYLINVEDYTEYLEYDVFNEFEQPILINASNGPTLETMTTLKKTEDEPSSNVNLICWSCNGIYSDSVDVCNRQGACSKYFNCECSGYFTGNDCLDFSCFGKSQNDPDVCDGRGKCIKTDECRCDSIIYTGDYCNRDSTLTIILIVSLISLIGFMFFCGCIIFLSCCVMICFFISVLVSCVFCCGGFNILEKNKKITNYQKLKDFDVLLKEQLVEEKYNPGAPVRLKIKKELSVMQYSELKLLEVIGRGGQSTVFKCEFRGQIVAFKKFSKNNSLCDEKQFEEFERELTIMSSIHHEHILNFYGVCLDTASFGLVLEFCENGDLKTFLTEGKGKEYNIPKRILLLYQISIAMEFMHSRNIIHRDLKCENVLISKSCDCKLTDFGLSRLFESFDAMSKTKGIGTSIFMAPEIVIGMDYDEKVDCYSMGIIIWEVLSFDFNPFGDTKENLRFERIEFKIATNPDLRPDIKKIDSSPDRLKKLARLCWSHDPENRPSFENIRDEIKECLENNEISIVLYLREKKKKKNKKKNREDDDDDDDEEEEEEEEDFLLKDLTVEGLQDICLEYYKEKNKIKKDDDDSNNIRITCFFEATLISSNDQVFGLKKYSIIDFVCTK